MPVLSAFTPLGILRLSSEPSYGESIYRAMVASLGDNYNVEPGSRMEATIYAQAMGLAETRMLLEHAGRQQHPLYVDEMIADREREYGLVPGPHDTLVQRQAALAARMLLPRGARREAVVDALTLLLGDNFVGYRTTPKDEITNSPTSLGDQPMNLQKPNIPRKIVRITTGISTGLGAPQTVTYTTVDPTDRPILRGDTIVVDPAIQSVQERVLITAATIPFPFTGTGTFTAKFNQPHDPNTLATTQPWPLWSGTQREALIFVKSAAAVDVETRRKINELMKRIARSVSTWAIVAETSPADVAGPFLLDVSPLNVTPFGLISLV